MINKHVGTFWATGSCADYSFRWLQQKCQRTHSHRKVRLFILSFL